MTIKKILQQIDTMTIDQITEVKFIQSLKENKVSLSNSDKRLLSNEISNFRKFDSQMILRRILLYSIWCPDEAIEVSRKKGVFRYKAWGLKQNHAEDILKIIKSQYLLMQYSKDTRQFIETKLQLSWMFSFYKDSEEKLINYIKKHHKERRRVKVGNVIVEDALFKELLAYVDCLFHFHTRSILRTNHINKNLLDGYGEEEISESISYIIYLYNSIIGIKNDCHYTVSPGYVLSDEIEKIILIGCKVHQLQEWEVCVDYFSYRIRTIGNVCIIYDKEERLEKSIRLGYIRRDMQEDLFYMRNRNNNQGDMLPLSEVCDSIKNNFSDKLISNVGTGNLSRFRFEFPEILFAPFHNEFANKLFEEEALSIGHCAKELIMNFHDASNKKITKNCTLNDVIMFQRFFILIDFVAGEILFQQKDKLKVIRSLIPCFKMEDLEKLLTIFIGDETKTKELISLFTYQQSIKLDLQYTPLLKSSGGIIFSTSLASKSNLLRNCIAYSYLLKNQIVNIDDLEPLVLECKNVFSSNHPEYQVFTNRKFSYLQQDGEIDVLVISKTDIIIIECKAPLNPTNNFEMRASYDHIYKAAKQLNLSKAAMGDFSFRKNFLKNLGIDNTPRNIYTCIVFGNRLFNGYTIESHPIRYIRELDMILNNGHIYSEAGIWRVWKNEEYSHSDLIDFLLPEYSLGISNLNSMDKVEQFMYIKGKKVIFETYAFNFAKVLMQYDKIFHIDSKNEEFRKKIELAYEESLKNITNK